MRIQPTVSMITLVLKKEQEGDDDDDDDGQEVVSGSLTGFATNQVNLRQVKKAGESKGRWKMMRKIRLD